MDEGNSIDYRTIGVLVQFWQFILPRQMLKQYLSIRMLTTCEVKREVEAKFFRFLSTTNINFEHRVQYKGRFITPIFIKEPTSAPTAGFSVSGF